jgi:hypothetical protein
LKIKHLRDFFGVLGFAQKGTFQARRPAPPVGTIFAGKTLVFSILLGSTLTTLIKTLKPLKIKGLGFWGSLWGCFGVALGFLDSLQKSHHNITPPYPTHRPAVVRKLNNVLHFF